MESITTKNLSYTIGSKTILNNINLNIPEGSIYGYLGRNGAGKSTTIKLLLGLLESSDDNIFIQNKSIQQNRTEILANTGNLIESPCFYTKLTVYENLKYLDIIYGKGSKRIEEVLELVDLHNEKKKKASALSMGMKQRLGIAMAIFHDPKLLILDEPLNGLDPQGIFEMRKLFQHLNELGKTIFLSSHILSELEKTATHIGIIEGGQMIFQGTKNDLLSKVEKEIILKASPVEKALALLQDTFSAALNNTNKISVKINNDKEFNGILTTLIQNGIEIYDIESQSTNLEQIFINLISKKHD
ncbi:ABC-2 type transport system ATP-binding protein [Chryseobacterium bernardetii]|uniref:ABC-2 type transport system ATP-binding protein n=2 Tax=Chryseobacterium TaxID=59732 RepID=A0A543EFL1_9FLAO|nr:MULTISPECIES: ATP-binding cassette domain-containing protein [Chryseobacterium]MDR6370414.1 ABC-2 type transport system ATP-binding protein [Chryseobacterium vietnamense]MDR6441420.1 ABC-2 type transport system ATP-binding protein [Chryseobacterium bernardetii]TQM20374.1 ABC-2 type transport system ATP-binding protein [Chryseobacterium aquifrigidense]